MYLVYSHYLDHIIIISVICVLIIVFTIILFYIVPAHRPPRCEILICFLTFIMSLMWIWFTANILITLIQTVANIMDIPKEFLAMTVLTYGNSLSDLILNVAMNIITIVN